MLSMALQTYTCEITHFPHTSEIENEEMNDFGERREKRLFDPNCQDLSPVVFSKFLLKWPHLLDLLLKTSLNQEVL